MHCQVMSESVHFVWDQKDSKVPVTKAHVVTVTVLGHILSDVSLQELVKLLVISH